MLIGLELFEKRSLRFLQIGVLHPLAKLGRLDKKQAVRLEQFEAMRHRRGRIGEMLQDVHQGDRVETAFGDGEILDRTHGNRHAKCAPAEIDDPGAQFDPLRFVAG